MVPLLIDKNPTDNDELTPLHLTTQSGKNRLFKYLAPFPNDKNPSLDEIENTRLHYAPRYGHLNIIKYLLPLLEDKDK